MRHWKIISAVAALLAEGALQISGFQCVPLAVVLAVLAVGLLIWSGWPTLSRIRMQSPIRLKSLDKENNIVDTSATEIIQPLSKIAIVLQAIDEAMSIIPKGKDVPVYITISNGLKSMYAQEILDILTKLQNDDKTIRLISFPTWLLPSDKLTGKDISDGVRAAIDPSLNKFVVQILEGFKSKN